MCGGEFDLQKGWTALIWAARNGHADCVRLLIEVGADKDAHPKVGILVLPLVLSTNTHVWWIYVPEVHPLIA